MKIVRQLQALRALTAAWHTEGLRIGVVPTMGALHAGHLSLVKMAKASADRVIVTIFVNPRQFNNAADIAHYPRVEREDIDTLMPSSVELLYIPPPIRSTLKALPPRFRSRG